MASEHGSDQESAGQEGVRESAGRVGAHENAAQDVVAVDADDTEQGDRKSVV